MYPTLGIPLGLSGDLEHETAATAALLFRFFLFYFVIVHRWFFFSFNVYAGYMTDTPHAGYETSFAERPHESGNREDLAKSCRDSGPSN